MLVNNIKIDLVYYVLHLPTDISILVSSYNVVHALLLNYNISDLENYFDFIQDNVFENNYLNLCTVSPYNVNSTSTDIFPSAL